MSGKTKTTSTKTASTSSQDAGASERALVAKWGKNLIAAGFTALPNVLFQYQKALQLKPLDVLIVLHLASYWWKPQENPWPSKGKIAQAIDVDPRTVQRSIKKMEDLGYIKRIFRKASIGDNLTNEYDLRGLIDAAEVHAQEQIALKVERAAADKRKRETPKTFALIDGGKKHE